MLGYMQLVMVCITKPSQLNPQKYLVINLLNIFSFNQIQTEKLTWYLPRQIFQILFDQPCLISKHQIYLIYLLLLFFVFFL